jgi:hypothetical protein
MKRQWLSFTSATVVATVFLAACAPSGEANHTGSDSALRTMSALDSEDVVAKARSVLDTTNYAFPLVVSLFERDATGYRVAFSPERAKVPGGSVLVYVDSQGNARVIAASR